MTEGFVLTFNLCIIKNNHKHHRNYYENLCGVKEDMLNYELLKKNLTYFSLVLSLAALFIVTHYEPFTNDASVVEIQSLNDSNFLGSMKAAQAQDSFRLFSMFRPSEFHQHHERSVTDFLESNLKRKNNPLSITANNKNPPIQPIRFEPNMIIYNRVQKCGSRSFLKAVRPIFGCHIIFSTYIYGISFSRFWKCSRGYSV